MLVMRSNTFEETPMPKLPDISGYSFDELSRLVTLARKRMEDFRGKRIKELQVELGRLSADNNPARRTRKNVGATAPSRRMAQNRAGGSGRKVAAQLRGPNGEEYSGRGAIPK